MKKIFLLFVIVGVGYSQTFVDTLSFTRVARSAAYASGDIMKPVGDSTAFLSIWTGVTRGNRSVGYITSVQLSFDTANVTGGSFIVRFFNMPDTTGLNASIAKDTALYQSNYLNSRYWVDDANISLSMLGTTAGGATGAMGSANNLNIPFFAPKGVLWVTIIAQGAYTPKLSGKVRLRVAFERTN